MCPGASEAGGDSCAEQMAAARPRARKTERRISHLLRGKTQTRENGFGPPDEGAAPRDEADKPVRDRSVPVRRERRLLAGFTGGHMRRLVHRATGPLFAVGILAAHSAIAQPALTLPQPSPKASVSQTVGLTDIAINYHRPAVNKRTIWGDLVPYDEVWRARANENTTISFSSPVVVNGKPLPAGTYGLHMIPTQGDWTIAFSKVSWAWGSFSY